MTIKLITCVGVDHDLALLPHFLRHYLELGIAPGRMHIVLNAPGEDSQNLVRARAVLGEHGIEPAEVWLAPYTSDSMWEKRREVQQRTAAASDWVISADVDEFHEFPVALDEFLRYCESKGVNCVQGVFIDRLAPDGRLADVVPDTPIWHRFPVEADVICTIRRAEEGKFWYGTVNIMACRGDVLPSRGGHHPVPGTRGVSYLFGRPLAEFPRITDPRFRFAIPLRVHHFKWKDTLEARLQTRLAAPGASSKGSAYGRLLLDHLARNGGIALDDVPIRRPGLVDQIPWRVRVETLRIGSRALEIFDSVRWRNPRWTR